MDSHGEKMLIKMEYLTVKFKSTVDAEKRFIRKVYVEVVRQDTKQLSTSI